MTGPVRDALADELRRAIREVPDFPKAGIRFKDITPVLLDHGLFNRTLIAMADPFRALDVTHVLAIESRGFLFGAPIALALGAALVPVRKPAKLPYTRVTESYVLEYGTDALEIHEDAFAGLPTPRVLVVDDVLATGGTAAACCRLAERLGATVTGVSVLLDLDFLPWQQALAGRHVSSLVTYR